jgi:O-antigen ligase
MNVKILDKDKINLLLISILPIGLLISSGAAESLIFIIIILYLKSHILNKNYSILKNFYFKLLVFIWIALIINFIFSQNHLESASRTFGFVRYILLVFAINFYFQKKNFRDIVLLFWLIVVAIVACDIFYEYYSGQNILGFQSNYVGRIASFLGKELKIGHFILGFGFIIIAFIFEKFQNKNLTLSLSKYFLIIFFIATIYITGEKANFLRSLFCLILFFILVDQKFIKYKKIILFLILMILMIIYNFSEQLKNTFGNRIFITFDKISAPIKADGLKQSIKNTQHGAHYYTALQIFNDYPIFGAGNKNFRYQCSNSKYFNNEYIWTDHRCSTHPHQIYFELLSEHGLFGTLSILSIIFYIIYKNIKIYLKNKNLIHLASILFIIQTFLPLIPSGSFFTSWPAIIFWLNFSIMISFSNNIRNKIVHK